MARKKKTDTICTIYRYYFDKGYKVQQLSYKVTRKVVEVKNGTETVLEMELKQVPNPDKNYNLPITLNNKQLGCIWNYSIDRCKRCLEMYDPRGNRLEEFKSLYEGAIRHYLSEIKSKLDDYNEYLEDWKVLETDLRYFG